MAFTDRYGLTVTTDSPVAFERFQKGMDDLLSYGPTGEERMAEALQADQFGVDKCRVHGPRHLHLVDRDR